MTRAERLPVIATTDGHLVYTSDGRTLGPLQLRPRTPAWTLGAACARNGIAQLWIHPSQTLTFDDPRGWDFATYDDVDAASAPWIHTFKAGTNTTVDLVRPELDKQSPWRTAQTARVLLNGLTLYRDLVGVTYHRSPSATSRELLINLHQGHKNSEPLKETRMPVPALDMTCETPLAWIADLTTTRLMAPRKYLTAYDKNGAYLGAASNLDLGAGEPQHLTRVNEADAKLPGYFLIRTPADGVIPMLPPLKRKADSRWVTTPTLAFLTERCGKLPLIHEAYVWMEHHQPLQPWYKRLRDARAALQAGYDVPGNREALAAVKASYTALLGGYMGSPGNKTWDRSGDIVYRPDIRHMVIATARSTLIRKAITCADAGTLPLAILGVDTLVFLSDVPDALPAPIQLGTGLAQYKVKWSGELTDTVREAIWDASHTDAQRLAAVRDVIER